LDIVFNELLIQMRRAPYLRKAQPNGYRSGEADFGVSGAGSSPLPGGER